ncbi:SIS domain-containing protein [Escherichia coli]|uniref:SIS domain-containing protein n=1 Tax=Escherichia coli TaxID=562 RepID=UPI000B7F5910|nr:SIS domain-containing protein [Escherichia coli]
MSEALLNAGRQTLMLELQEASRLPERLGDDFVRAANIILHCEGKVVVSGIGKSGHIGKKIAATLASTGTPAFFVHPAEALHGDLGMIESRDVMLELSRTGLGLVAVCDAQQQVQGVFTDGDLRRWLVGGGALTTPVNEAMTVGGTTLQSQSRAIDAKEILMKRKITAAPVVDENGKLTGAINLQDFYQAGII